MSALDNVIDSGVRKHRLFAVLSGSALVIALAVYLFWLFLLQGFTVLVAPQEAKEQAQFRTVSGAGFMLGNKLYLLGSNATIEVSAHLYIPKQVTVDSDTPSNIEVTLKPQPAVLNATSNPGLDNAVWRIDGELLGEGPQFRVELPEGEFELSVSHPFYQSQSTLIETSKGQQLSHQFQLEPVSGEMHLSSIPAGAQVHIDGVAVGTTPLVLERNGGDYEVWVEAEGYEPVSDLVRVSVDSPRAERNYRLELLKAILTAEVQPSGGILTVNEQPVANPARVNANQPLLVKYEKEGYWPASERIELSPGEEHSLRFNLQTQLGKVNISANVPAEVRINGAVQGRSPLQLNLQTVPQTLEFRQAGYRTQEVEVLPSAAAERNVAVELLTEFDARRAEGRPLFANTIGINLIPVSLQTFTMGSPLSESGRNRNEVQREVSFTRNIWMSTHEITEGQYARFSGQGDVTSELPVTNVSWIDAARFTNWLSEQEGLRPFYIIRGDTLLDVRLDSRGYRLPSEAEWEFVAKHFRRAARTQYIWGNQSVLRENQANFADESLRGEQTFVLRDYQDNHKGKAPVGSYPADRNGFYDLAGNVREWVHDYYQLLPAGNNNEAPAAVDYLGPDSGNSRVVKGASYLTGQMPLLRASVRGNASEPAADIGFRIARYHN